MFRYFLFLDSITKDFLIEFVLSYERLLMEGVDFWGFKYRAT